MRKIRLIIITFFIAIFSGTCYNIPRSHPVNLYRISSTDNPVRQCDLPVLVMNNNKIPESMQKIVKEEIEYWNSLSSKKIFFYMGETDWESYSEENKESGIILVISIKETKPDKHKTTLAYTSLRWYNNGCITGQGITLYLDTLDKSSDNRIRSVIRHELGHTLGFVHSKEDDDLMYKSIGSYIYDDLKELSEWELKAFKIFYE